MLNTSGDQVDVGQQEDDSTKKKKKRRKNKKKRKKQPAGVANPEAQDNNSNESPNVIGGENGGAHTTSARGEAEVDKQSDLSCDDDKSIDDPEFEEDLKQFSLRLQQQQQNCIIAVE